MSFNDIARSGGGNKSRPVRTGQDPLSGNSRQPRRPSPSPSTQSQPQGGNPPHSAVTIVPSQNDSNTAATISSVSRAIFQISSNISRLRRSVSYLGTPRDTATTRTGLDSTISQTTELIRNTERALKDVPRGIEQQKLIKDFKAVVREFQKEQQGAASKLREVVASARAVVEDEQAQEEAPLLSPGSTQAGQYAMQSQTFAPSALDAEIVHNEAMIIEREEEVRRIEQGITEINEIFRDLGTLVGEQSNMLDNIETNVSNIAATTDNAHSELVRASKSQRGYRNKMCYILLGLLVVVLILVLIVIPKG